MNDLRDTLRGAAARPSGPVDLQSVRRLFVARRRRRRVALSTAAIVSLLIVLAVAGVDAGHERHLVPSRPVDTTPASVSTAPTTLSTEPPPAKTTPTSLLADGTVLVSAHVVDEAGNPFPNGTGAVMACDRPAGHECPVTGAGAMVVGADTDNDGLVHLELKPDTTYRVTGMATNTGWCGAWINPNGVPFHFSHELVTRGADLDGATLVVLKPPCA